LGVLKKSAKFQLDNPSSDPDRRPLTVPSSSVIEFVPPLPLPLIRTIATMGFGVLNKVILTYPSCFWGMQQTLFGFANNDIQRRGEFFLFWSLYSGHNTLVALVAGEAAVQIERNCADAAIVTACQNTLRKIFGSEYVLEPTETVVTRWGQDRLSCGSYSSVAPGATGASYDQLAMPLPNADEPKIFFAGEHTVRNYPATVHGALISGLREATRIADAFLDEIKTADT
jgi:[histone H3]-N6,N6-dimethyl-L-lysine4 FAD-dependent demethylase